MISTIEGCLAEKNLSSVVIEAGGIGYELAVSAATFERLGDPGSQIKLFTFQYVREDALDLYGFISRAEKQLFLLLLKVSGIGPKIALAVLSGLSVKDFYDALRTSDLERLTSISGIGKKTAERVIIELRDKIPAEIALSVTHASSGGKPSIDQDAVEALTTLGFSPQTAKTEVSRVRRESGDFETVEELIRCILQNTK